MIRWFYLQSSLKRVKKKDNNKNNGTDVLKKNSGQFCSVMQNSLFFLKEKYNFPAVSPFKIKIYHYYKHKISNYTVSYH